jgi:O-antigen ligase
MPFLPKSYTDRMSTIENHQSDQSASTRVAVWKWTWEFAKHNPFGGGFEAYRQNEVSYKTVNTDYAGKNNAALETNDIVEKGRAYHSAYFEMLGEQGYPGLGLWLTLHLLGLWQMERVRARWTKRGGPQETCPMRDGSGLWPMRCNRGSWSIWSAAASSASPSSPLCTC